MFCRALICQRLREAAWLRTENRILTSLLVSRAAFQAPSSKLV
jgi:hypothetical protein